MKNIISVRWMLAFLGIYASALLFAQRASLSVSIVAMTSDKFTKSPHLQVIEPLEQTHECAANKSTNKNTRWRRSISAKTGQSEPEFNWNEKTQVKQN